ncbi:hypothetical protein NW762_012788 [Fusarium torreyae]|uniref:Xylanolytic transcriptional activator regulatory domain-containing protein n=1 Tax=Fusarium torreyae TaxID=1237075 RepID=A0A9W8RPZ9_9HYPO|nr:hypothetical protein NW762_012788 [Fusarium torreyae]
MFTEKTHQLQHGHGDNLRSGRPNETLPDTIDPTQLSLPSPSSSTDGTDQRHGFEVLEQFLMNSDHATLHDSTHDHSTSTLESGVTDTHYQAHNKSIIEQESPSVSSPTLLSQPGNQRKSFHECQSSLLESHKGTNTFVIHSYYPFASAEVLGSLTPEDMTFLEKRGSFHLPSRNAMGQFMREYFLHVHPLLPLLDENEFWTMYDAKPEYLAPQKTISLFLLQAMLFVSSAAGLPAPYVPLTTLHDLGCSSVREARAKFYAKAKALFDIDTRRDHISRAQGALILTYHTTSLRDEANTYWLSTAVYLARCARADYYAEVDGDTKDKAPLKRLWWSCVVRDRIMSLGLQRPMCIGQSDFDFNQSGLTELDFEGEIDGSQVYGPAIKRILAQLAVSLCEFSTILNPILSITYPRKAVSPSEDPLNDIGLFESHVARLDSWHDGVGSTLNIPEQAGMHDSLTLFTAASNIYYK